MSTIQEGPSFAPLGSCSPTKFPAAGFAIAASYFDAYVDETARAAKSVDPVALDRAAEVLISAHARGARIFSCGNGGSAAIANHMQCDHMRGVAASTDLAPKVTSLSSNVELMTAIANDTSYDNVFAHQLQWQAAPGDVLIAISSSGRSPNIINAINWARSHQVITIAITGFGGGDARLQADVSIHVDAANYGVVEDLHQLIMHALAQYLRQSRMTDDAISTTVF